MIEKITKQDIGKTILLENQFPVKIKYVRENIIPSKTCDDGSFYPGCTEYQYGDSEGGWYTLSAIDKWQEA